MFTHPTANQLSEIAADNYHFHPKDVGEALSHLATLVEPCDLKAGDYIESDGWHMVTAYNADGFGEVFVAEPREGQWKHHWFLYGNDEHEVKPEVSCLRREVVSGNMEEKYRIQADQLPGRPTFISVNACNGMNNCCQRERSRA